MALTWHQSVELAPGDPARGPADARRAWVHRAPEPQVLALYQDLDDAALPAPWWLRALAAGGLPSRAAGFAVEDQVARLLAERAGWVFVPWSAVGDVGYWEYMPSEHYLDVPGQPTTLVLTDRHPGWLDVYPVHATGTPQPLAVAGPDELHATLARIEALR